MNFLIRIKLLIFILIISSNIVRASSSPVPKTPLIDRNSLIAVMDLGIHEKNANIDFDLTNAELATSEYIIQRLISKYNLNVVDKVLIQDKLKEENLNTTGIIDPDTAKRISEILGFDYLIYGNVLSVTIGSETTARVITRIMDIRTGKLIMASKGKGTSGTSNLQENLHNALKKAAFQSVDIIVERLYGKS